MSVQARAIETAFKLFGFHRIIQKQMKDPGRSTKKFVPKKIEKKYRVERQFIDNREVITFDRDLNYQNRHIVFFHGGGYIFEISSMHWELLDRLAESTKSRMTVINFPLAPESTYWETFQMVFQTYDFLVKTYPRDEYVFMGDSAGGGLALAAVQELVNRDFRPLPKRLVLLSPFMDLTLKNIDFEDGLKADVILDDEFLHYCADAYAGGDNKKLALLSPLYGVLDNLPDTAVFYGTHELLMADCLKLKDLVKRTNSKFCFKEYKNMPHDWGIFPIPERDRLIADIHRFLESNIG